MKRSKRLPSLLLALMMAISLFPGSALGAPETEPMESSEMIELEATSETTPELMVELEATFESPEEAKDNLSGSYPESDNENIGEIAGEEELRLGLLSNVTTVSDVALLQSAIDMAAVDDMIVLDIVSPATLPATLNIDKSLTFYSENQLTLFVGSGRHVSVSGAAVALTFGNITLDGQSNSGGIVSSASQLSLNGVSIQKTLGAGVQSGTGCDLDIVDCAITESANRGINCGGSITVVDSVIEKNSSISGGGIYSVGNVTVSGSTKVNNNKATGSGTNYGGGGIFATGDVTVLDNAQICDNMLSSSGTPGGGIRVMAEDATVTIQGGTISDNTATGSGGGIYVTNYLAGTKYNVNVYLSGDTVISGNKTGTNGLGGGLCVAGNITMSGGTISQNTARAGGGIHILGLFDDTDAPVPGTTTLMISGGLISGNTSTSLGGGGIYSSHESGKTIITGDAEITYNQVSGTSDGGAISSGGDVEISGGLIAYNEARHGGAVYWGGEDKTFEISDGEIRNNTARSQGGAIYANGLFSGYSELKMSGGKISNNTAQTSNGGAIRASGSDLGITIAGGEISGNKALAGKGGGIYSESTTIQLSNTLFKSNTALNGGGIYGDYWSVITVGDESKFLHNEATGSGANDGGGGIHIEELASLTTKASSVFSGNKAVRAVNLTSTSLISQHGTKILGTIYTDPFIYLYNNYDVNVPDSAGTVMQIHSVTFNYNYADAQEPYERINIVIPETTAGSKMPTEPARDHYEFKGWNTQADGLGTAFTSTSVVAADLTVFASWVPVTYTVSFESNGGTAVADITDALFDTTILAPAPPTKDHHTFVGWYKEPALTNVWDFSVDKIAGNTTLYAKWTPLSYTVTFAAGTQGTMLPDPATELVVYNANITSTPAITENAGWVFIGWESSQTGILYNDAALMDYPVTDNVTFTAHYERSEKAVVIFDYQGGVDASGNASTVLSDYPGEVLICPSDPTKNGYTFNGWDRVPPATYGAAGSSITYYAQWIELVSDTTDTTDSTGLIKAAKSGDSLIANTGDFLPVWLLIMFMSAAVGGGVFLRMANKRKKTERN